MSEHERQSIHVFPDETGSRVITFIALWEKTIEGYEVTRFEAPVLAWLVRVDETTSPDDGWMQYDEPVPIVIGGLHGPVYCVFDPRVGTWKFPEMMPFGTEAAALDFGREAAVEADRAEREAMRARRASP